MDNGDDTLQIIWHTYTFCFLGFLRGEAPSGKATDTVAGFSAVLLLVVATAILDVTVVPAVVTAAISFCSFFIGTGGSGTVCAVTGGST